MKAWSLVAAVPRCTTAEFPDGPERTWAIIDFAASISRQHEWNFLVNSGFNWKG
jgi:hypothetical protein